MQRNRKSLAEYFVPKIVKLFNPKYVLDVGCGSGQWLDEYRKHNIKTKGIEGSSNAWPAMSDETKEVVLEWDLRDIIPTKKIIMLILFKVLK